MIRIWGRLNSINVQKVLWAMSRWNDRVQTWLFDPRRLAHDLGQRPPVGLNHGQLAGHGLRGGETAGLAEQFRKHITEVFIR